MAFALALAIDASPSTERVSTILRRRYIFIAMRRGTCVRSSVNGARQTVERRADGGIATEQISYETKRTSEGTARRSQRIRHSKRSGGPLDVDVDVAESMDELDVKAREIMASEGVSYGEALEMLNAGGDAHFERSARHGGIERRFGPEEERLAAMRKELGSHDVRRFTPSNAGAYEEFERRIRAFQREGLCHADATKRALEEVQSADRMDAVDGPSRKRDDYLGASIASLMATYHPKGHGSRSAGRKTKDSRAASKDARDASRDASYQRALWNADRAVSRVFRAAGRAA